MYAYLIPCLFATLFYFGTYGMRNDLDTMRQELNRMASENQQLIKELREENERLRGKIERLENHVSRQRRLRNADEDEYKRIIDEDEVETELLQKRLNRI